MIVGIMGRADDLYCERNGFVPVLSHDANMLDFEF
jgi:hypothetical protein